MAWNIEGRYFENCSCNVVCPCTASLAMGADYDHCRAGSCSTSIRARSTAST